MYEKDARGGRGKGKGGDGGEVADQLTPIWWSLSNRSLQARPSSALIVNNLHNSLREEGSQAQTQAPRREHTQHAEKYSCR